VRVAVVPGDVKEFEADVLLLKHAQHFYGADEEVALRLSRARTLDLERFHLQPGATHVAQSKGTIAAASVIFVGVPHIFSLDYSDIREFTAIGIAASSLLSAQTIALTVHGPGFGLDEVESLFAEFAGVVKAVGSREAKRLQELTFVERDRDRVGRLGPALENALERSKLRWQRLDGWAFQVTIPLRGTLRSEAVEVPGDASDAKPHVFVAMPFADDMNDRFFYGIQPPVRRHGFLCERIDQAVFTGSILTQIREKIASAALVVADLSGANPNVYLEVGLAWGRDRATILLAHESEPLRFDVQGERCLKYNTIQDLERQLDAELKGLKPLLLPA